MWPIHNWEYSRQFNEFQYITVNRNISQGSITVAHASYKFVYSTLKHPLTIRIDDYRCVYKYFIYMCVIFTYIYMYPP